MPSARTYVGPWLPEPLVAETAPPPDQAVELASDLSVAFLALLERLVPEERAAFLLHEVFDSGYDDISKILGKSETACRQIVSRARRRVRDAQPRVQVSPAARARLIDSFVQALRAGDKDALVKLFAEDAAWTSDGGGKAKAAHKIIRGADNVVRFALGVLHRYLDRLRFEPVTVNGEAGLALRYGDQLLSIMSFRTDGARILDVYSVLNPDKLRGVKFSDAA